MKRIEQLEAIAVTQALAASANSTEEYLRWSARETELRGAAGTLSESEGLAVERMAAVRLAEYEACRFCGSAINETGCSNGLCEAVN